MTNQIQNQKKPDTKTDMIDQRVISNLQEIHGVGKKTAEELFTGGFITVTQIAASNATEMSAKTNIGFKTCEKIIEGARAIELKKQFTTAKIELERRTKLKRFTTGVKDLDRLIGGGIETMSTVEIAGEFRTGKTQIVLQLCVTVQLDEKNGGLGAKAIFMDCEGTFRPERVVNIIKRFELDKDTALDNIILMRIFDSDQLLQVLKGLPDIVNEHNVKLVVIDSIISHLRSEYIGRETLSERQQLLSKIMLSINKLCYNNDVAVVYTNQVLDDPSIMYGNPQRPAGGNIMAHAASYRIQLRKASEAKRVAKLIDCSYLPESEALFKITENGIEDIDLGQKKEDS
jgi:DNA repair protein RadA